MLIPWSKKSTQNMCEWWEKKDEMNEKFREVENCSQSCKQLSEKTICWTHKELQTARIFTHQSTEIKGPTKTNQELPMTI